MHAQTGHAHFTYPNETARKTRINILYNTTESKPNTFVFDENIHNISKYNISEQQHSALFGLDYVVL